MSAPAGSEQHMPATDATTLRLCLVAPSGSGKSTSAQLMRSWFVARGRSVAILKLAAPLYRLQASFYAEAGVSLQHGAQDQRLLESVATQLRSLHPAALANRFLQTLQELDAEVVINDDLRDDGIDWPALRQAGFVIVKLAARPELRARRLAVRNDVSVVHDSPLDQQMARIRPDYVLTNNGSLAALEVQIDGLCRRLAAQRLERHTP